MSAAQNGTTGCVHGFIAVTVLFLSCHNVKRDTFVTLMLVQNIQNSVFKYAEEALD